MSQVNSTTPAVDLFKKRYGKTNDLVPKNVPFERDIEWSDGQKVGDEYIEAVVLGNEVGITLGGSGADSVEINPAVAGPVKQAKVSPYQTILPSQIPWATISRSAEAGERAFFNATKHVVKNNLRSHSKFQEIFRLYGQATGGLGYVSYATATYRGVSLTNGGGSINSITFTAGVNTSTKQILLAPGSFAAGIWVGMKGLRIGQRATASGLIVAAGTLQGVNTKYGYLTVDFVPVAASSATSHDIVILGQEDSKEMIGMHKVLATEGTIFNINNSQFELYKGNVIPVTGKLTLEKIVNGVADAVNAGELEGDLDLYLNPRSWGTLTTDEAAFRKHDAKYSEEKATAGFKDVEFYSQNGKISIKAHRYVKEGHAFGLVLDTWSRSGSAQISFTVPGVQQEMIFPVQNQTAMAFRSFSDQYMFCHRPSWNLLFTGINDEATS